MNNDYLKIGKPQVIVNEDRAVLHAEIWDCGTSKILEYCVDPIYGSYLTCERSDAFVTALLYYAMIRQLDIEWETPCNEQLIYQLETFFIPVYAREMPFMHTIRLKGPTTTETLPCARGVATGISNGVDSCYTIHRYIDVRYRDNRLTHLVFTDFFTTDFSEEYRQDFLKHYLSVLPVCARELGLEFIYVEFHPDIPFSVGHIQDSERGVIQDAGMFTLKYCSIAMALQKLFRIYYFSSGVTPSDFSFRTNDFAYHDLFTLPLITTETLSFYSVGMEVPRIEKVSEIAEWDYAQKYLQVCAFNNDCNCGCCSKCIRTMSELYAIGKLDLFQQRFPVSDYQEHLSRRFAAVLMEACRGHVFEKDILAKMRETGKRIPVKAYLLAPFYVLKEAVRIQLRTRKWARWLYRKFRFDRILYGRSTERFTQSVDREILGSDGKF